MRNIEVSDDKRLLLRLYVETSPVTLVRLKCQAILMRTNGMKLGGIADVVSRSERTVRDWFTDWEEGKMASFFSGCVGNENAAKLT